uniref:Uncharacterized protein n=1 Tax=Avena sativa TaxID=4498 RepID=A0ACD5WR03_AVESA
MAEKRARHAGGAAEVADDFLRDVFVRVAPGLPDLLRCAATCRRWRRLVTDRAFLRRIGHWPDTARRPCVLAGIFSQNTYPSCPTRLLPKRKPFCYRPRFSSLRAGGGTPVTYDLLVGRDDDDGLFELARPLASRRGFLLVRVLLPGDYPGQKLHLAVCRPLVDKRSTRLLPAPPFDMTEHYRCGLPRDSNLIGYAIVTGADHNDDDSDHLDRQGQQQPPVFQVVLIYDDIDDGFVCACAYSSDTGTWSAPVHCCRASGLIMCGPRAGVVAGGGTVHWLFMHEINKVYYTLSISTATSSSRVSLTKIPIKVHPTAASRPPIPCIAGAQGRLSFITIRDHGVAELWTSTQDEDDDDWRCSELADLGSKRINLIFFAERRRALLVEQGGAFSVVDLETKERTPVHFEGEGTRRFGGDRCFPEMCTPPVLYEMDLVFSPLIM